MGESVSVRTVLLGIEGHQDDEMAVAALCDTLDLQSTTLRIVNILTVPMTAPLDAPMPEVEPVTRAWRLASDIGVSPHRTRAARPSA